MKVLLLTSEEWNDTKYGNNNMSNWFEGFPDIELAHVYCSSGKPENQCCREYFQVTDKAMLKSLLGKERAGNQFTYINGGENKKTASHSGKPVPKFIKNEFFRGIRDVIWRYGKVNTAKLREFLDEFHPDLVFSQRKASLRILKVEREVKKLLPDVPFIVYTADDEYSLKQFSLDPVFWMRRIALRSYMRRNVKFYDLYYTDAEQQAEEYRRLFHVKTKFLAKCGDFDLNKCHKTVHNPIRIVYAGKLYCGRWKTLEKIAIAVSHINNKCEKQRFMLEIYTQSPIRKRYRKWLDNQSDSFIRGSLSSEQVLKIYEESDLVLHVESFDLKNRLLTRYSFSTKIIDCMSTGCAVMAVCDKSQNGLQYLRKNNAAITVDSASEIEKTLMDIAENTEILAEYAKYAIECGRKNHQKQTVQENLRHDIQQLISDYKKLN